MATANEENWKKFLSSIENVPKNDSTQQIITTKSKIKCLAGEFATNLIQDQGGTVTLKGKKDVLNRYKHFDVSKNQTETPITNSKFLLEKAQTWPNLKNETIGELTRTRSCIQLLLAPSDSSKIIQEVPQTDTNEQVIETSDQSADVITPEVPHTDTNEHVKETSVRSMKAQICIEVSVADIPFVVDDIDIHRKGDTKKDIDKSCSGWDVSRIAKYFNFKKCVNDITMPTELPPCKDDIIKKVQTNIGLRLNTVQRIDLTATEGTSDSTFLMQLKSITITEAGSRLVLDPLLVSLCSELGLQFEVEKNIKCNFLPNCTFDYCIRKGKRIIGCIEAKSRTGLSNKSVAQAVIELMILQTTLIATETPKVDISKSPVFAIVTDGHRFIYIELKGSSLGFEHEVVKEKGKEIKKLKIRKVTKEGDWKEILQLITFLVQGDKKRE